VKIDKKLKEEIISRPFFRGKIITGFMIVIMSGLKFAIFFVSSLCLIRFMDIKHNFLAANPTGLGK